MRPWVLLALAACNESQLVPIGDGETVHPLPDIELRPTALELGEHVVGEHAGATFVVANVGDAELAITDVRVRKLEGEGTITMLGEPFVSPGGQTEVAVDVVVGVEGLDEGLVMVMSDDPDEPTLSLPLSITGLGVKLPNIVVDPVSHDFGIVSTTSTPKQPVTVTNTGEAPLTVTGIAWASSSSSELWLASDGKLTAGATLAPGESRALEVWYSPNDDLADEATLIVFSDDPDLSEATASFFGDGEVIPPSTDHDVAVWITADDQWSGTLDGADVTGPNAAAWSTCDTFTEVLPTGEHVLAVHAWDVAAAISGLAVVIEVDGADFLVTGDSRIRMTTSKPSSGWEDPAFDDSAWTTPKNCASTSPWGGSPPALFAAGPAKWVWTNTDCTVLGEAWFRIPIDLP